MANRSYLYSIDKIPSDQKETLSIKGLSEYPYQIPPAYLMLVGGNTRLCNSIIWDYPEKVALAGEYDLGLDNLKMLIKLLTENGVERPEKFKKAADDALSFLLSAKVKKKYILLETGEIWEMTDEVNEENTRVVLRDIDSLMQDIKNVNMDKINEYVGDDITSKWEGLLGIDYWSEVLYYNFD